MNCAITELSDIGEFLAIESEWNVLLAESHCDIPFLRHEWLRTWWHHFGPPNRLAIVIGRRESKLVFALPLMEIRSSYAGIPITVLQSLTNHHSFRFNLIVRLGDEDTINDFWGYLRGRGRRWHTLVLQELPCDSPLWQLTIDAARRHQYPVGTYQASQSPYLPINGHWDAYLQTRSNHFMKQLRRAGRLLGEVGNGFSLELTGGIDWDPDGLAEALEIESRGWKGESGTAIACDPNLASFYTKWARTAHDRGWLRLCFLKTSAARVAFEYAVEYAGRWYALKASYDPAFRQYSPGQLLCREVLQLCFGKGVGEYDFLGDVAEDKARWTEQTRPHGWLYVYNDSFLSTVHYAMKFFVKPWIKRRMHKSRD